MYHFGIVHENKNILIINKNCGDPVQSKDQDLVKYLSSQRKNPLHLINRIDQPVSGLVLLAKNKRAAAYYSNLEQEDKIEKYYIAIVEGKLTTNGSIESSIIKKGEKAFIDPNGKDCKLHYEILKELDRYTILKIKTETGRFHQIRVQLSSIGHPIKGDLKYGAKRSNKEGGIYLHCHNMIIKDGDEYREYIAKFPMQMVLYGLIEDIGTFQ